jgi:hypothetical protein
LTIRIARAWPSWILLAAFWMPKVAVLSSFGAGYSIGSVILRKR